MARRRSFRGRRRSQWRNQAWGYTPIGEANANGHFTCAAEQPPGTQAFWPVLTNEMFAPAASTAPFKQERVLALRTLGQVELFYSFAVGPGEDRMPSQVRWALALLDEEAVNDTAYAFPSLFLPDFAQTERVLLTGIAKPVAHASQIIPEVSDFTRNRAWIEWDQGLKTKVETGSTIWLVTEVALCDDAFPGVANLAPWLLGYTRALWRD